MDNQQLGLFPPSLEEKLQEANYQVDMAIEAAAVMANSALDDLLTWNRSSLGQKTRWAEKKTATVIGR